jgi:hypothetical protein
MAERGQVLRAWIIHNGQNASNIRKDERQMGTYQMVNGQALTIVKRRAVTPGRRAKERKER